jgi:hypothetical protein
LLNLLKPVWKLLEPVHPKTLIQDKNKGSL